MTDHQINLEFYWPEKLYRSEKLENELNEYFSKHQTLTSQEKIEYTLKHLADRDFCIFTFGSDSWNYLQFARDGSNLDFNFPYNHKMGNRYLQIDRVNLILKSHGFKSTPPFWANIVGNEKYMYFTDTMYDQCLCLDAYFGIHHERFASEVTLEIARMIFHYTDSTPLTITAGSWKG